MGEILDINSDRISKGNNMFEKNRIVDIITNFDSKRILIVGDIMLDEYIWGRVHRISPEAPVPVVDVTDRTIRLGGAANVVQNLSSVGISTYIAAICGNDSNGKILIEALEKSGCNTSAVINSPSRPTTTKTRIMAHQQQVVRVDSEDTSTLTHDEEQQLIQAIASIIDSIDAVVISDYGKGVITPSLLKELTAMTSARKIFVSVDPKEKHWDYYSAVDVITPNLKEGYESLGLTLKGMPEDSVIIENGWKIVDKYSLKYLLLTLSEKGMMLFDGLNRKETHLHTVAKEVYDVTGAGDTVISLFTAAIAAGADPIEATFIANHGAGITVGEIGTASVTAEELISTIYE